MGTSAALPGNWLRINDIKVNKSLLLVVHCFYAAKQKTKYYKEGALLLYYHTLVSDFFNVSDPFAYPPEWRSAMDAGFTASQVSANDPLVLGVYWRCVWPISAGQPSGSVGQASSGSPFSASSIVPHDPKPYNVRIYLLGRTKEGVYLTKPVVRRPRCAVVPAVGGLNPNLRDPNAKFKFIPTPRTAIGEEGRPGPSLESGSTKGDLSLRSPEELAGNKLRAGRRAKTRIRRKVEANDLGRMLSVTFDTNEDAKVRTRPLNRRGGDVVDDLTSWEDARYYFGLFVERVRRKCKKLGLPYGLIAVEEVQKRGVQHFHFATNLPFTHAEWLSLWGYGTVWYSGETGNRSSRRREVRDPGSSVAAVSSYMTKYLAKTFDEVEDLLEPGSVRRTAGAARYHASRSLVLPFVEYLIEPENMGAFHEKLGEGGFEVVGDPFLVEKDGYIFAWWQKSVRLAMESKGVTPAPAGACAEDARGAVLPFT